MKKYLLAIALLSAGATHAGWFATASESYLTSGRHVGNGVYQCVYKTNPGNQGWMQFSVNFQGGCPRQVTYNAQNGQVSNPR